MSTESCSTVRVRGEEVNSRINEVAGGYGRSARLENPTLSFVSVQFHGFRTTQTFKKNLHSAMMSFSAPAGLSSDYSPSILSLANKQID